MLVFKRSLENVEKALFIDPPKSRFGALILGVQT